MRTHPELLVPHMAGIRSDRSPVPPEIFLRRYRHRHAVCCGCHEAQNSWAPNQYSKTQLSAAKAKLRK